MKQPDKKLAAVEVGQIICDFCSVPGPTVEFPCGDLEELQVVVTPGRDGAPGRTVKKESAGGWLACVQCAAAVERARGKGDPGAWGLAVYVARRFAARHKRGKAWRDLAERSLFAIYAKRVLPNLGEAIPYTGPQVGVTKTLYGVKRPREDPPPGDASLN